MVKKRFHKAATCLSQVKILSSERRLYCAGFFYSMTDHVVMATEALIMQYGGWFFGELTDMAQVLLWFVVFREGDLTRMNLVLLEAEGSSFFFSRSAMQYTLSFYLSVHGLKTLGRLWSCKANLASVWANGSL